MKALVVARESDRLLDLGQQLEANGFGVELVADPTGADERIGTTSPDVLILDSSIGQTAAFRLYELLRDADVDRERVVAFIRHSSAEIARDGADLYFGGDSGALDIAVAVGQACGLPAGETPPTQSLEAAPSTGEPAPADLPRIEQAPLPDSPSFPPRRRNRGKLILVVLLVVIVLVAALIIARWRPPRWAGHTPAIAPGYVYHIVTADWV